MMDSPWNENLNFDDDPNTIGGFSQVEEGVYQNVHGMPFKTAEEFERHYYMLGNTRMASMWTIVDELDTALSVAAQLED